MKDFETILKFGNVYDLLSECADDFIDSLSDIGIEAVKDLDDPFDPFEYFLIDFKTIYVCETGSVVGKYDKISVFVDETRKHLSDRLKDIDESPWSMYKNGCLFISDENDMVYRNNKGKDFILTEAMDPRPSPGRRGTYDIIVAMPYINGSDFGWDCEASTKWFAGAYMVEDFCNGKPDELLYACHQFLDE